MVCQSPGGVRKGGSSNGGSVTKELIEYANISNILRITRANFSLLEKRVTNRKREI